MRWTFAVAMAGSAGCSWVHAMGGVETTLGPDPTPRVEVHTEAMVWPFVGMSARVRGSERGAELGVGLPVASGPLYGDPVFGDALMLNVDLFPVQLGWWDDEPSVALFSPQVTLGAAHRTAEGCRRAQFAIAALTAGYDWRPGGQSEAFVGVLAGVGELSWFSLRRCR
jgi:hypothetical protein